MKCVIIVDWRTLCVTTPIVLWGVTGRPVFVKTLVLDLFCICLIIVLPNMRLDSKTSLSLIYICFALTINATKWYEFHQKNCKKILCTFLFTIPKSNKMMKYISVYFTKNKMLQNDMYTKKTMKHINQHFSLPVVIIWHSTRKVLL